MGSTPWGSILGDMVIMEKNTETTLLGHLGRKYRLAEPFPFGQHCPISQVFQSSPIRPLKITTTIP